MGLAGMGQVASCLPIFFQLSEAEAGGPFLNLEGRRGSWVVGEWLGKGADSGVESVLWE